MWPAARGDAPGHAVRPARKNLFPLMVASISQFPRPVSRQGPCRRLRRGGALRYARGRGKKLGQDKLFILPHTFSVFGDGQRAVRIFIDFHDFDTLLFKKSVSFHVFEWI